MENDLPKKYVHTGMNRGEKKSVALRWLWRSSEMVKLAALYRAPLERLYRYFAVQNPSAVIQTLQGERKGLADDDGNRRAKGL